MQDDCSKCRLDALTDNCDFDELSDKKIDQLYKIVEKIIHKGTEENSITEELTGVVKDVNKESKTVTSILEVNNRFLFKAKRIDNGEWVQGFYYVFMGKHYIFEQPFENNNLTHQVDESTICQCTGLRDKNGRLIFENDILKCGSCTVVHWNEKYASWTLTRKGWMYDHFFGEAEDPEDCEIVGNIFDDSQLKEKYSKE